MWLLFGVTCNPEALLGRTIETPLIPHFKALFTILTQKKLFPPILLRWANTTVLIRLWRLATIERADPLFMGSDALQRRLVLEVSVLLEALRQTGRPTDRPGIPTAFTMLPLVLSSDRHLPLPPEVELLLSVCDLFRVVENGLIVLFSMGRLELVSPPPQVCVIPSPLLVRGQGYLVIRPVSAVVAVVSLRSDRNRRVSGK